jgi:flagellar motility protein MotE (MotC chaperone)
MDSKDWQELVQQLLLDVQKTNQEQLRMLGELKADIEAIKQKQEDQSKTLDRHEVDIANLKQVQERHKSYFKIIGSAFAAVVTIISALIAFFRS